MNALALAVAFAASADPADGQLLRTDARALTDLAQISLGAAHEWLADAVEYLRQCWAGHADAAAEYDTWLAYVEAGSAAVRRLRIPPAMRAEAAAHLADAGMTGRKLAATVGVNEATS
jgi:hypothetical protein